MRGWLNKFIRIRVVERDQLNDEELGAAFCMLEEWHLVFRATMQVLDDHIDDMTMLTSDIKTAQNPSVLAHCAGGLDALRSLKEDLLSRAKASL